MRFCFLSRLMREPKVSMGIFYHVMKYIFLTYRVE
ncbi:hypothetical protein EMIT0P228_100251 [Pseudomonas brassicacearum]